MNKLGILGFPLGHSVSPAMHNSALEFLQLEGSYEKLETAPEELEEKIEFLKNSGYKGVNVTIPFKVEVTKYIDKIDESAQIAEAVNVIKFNPDGSIDGFNTDIYGFLHAIDEDSRKNLKGKTAAVLGAGGASRAVIIALSQLGVSKINLFARDLQKADALVNVLKKNINNILFETQELNKNINLEDIKLLVNTTPVGMKGKDENASPVSKESIDTLPNDSIVYDIVYNPVNTRLLEMSKKRGLKVIAGLDMLVLQGAKAFEIWTGIAPPVEVMKKAAQESL